MGSREGGSGYLWRQKIGRCSGEELEVDSVVWQGHHCTQGISEVVSPRLGQTWLFSLWPGHWVLFGNRKRAFGRI